MIRFIPLPDPSSGIPYVNTDFTSVLQDEHLKSYASILDGINQGSTSSTEPLNSGIILNGCDILSHNGSQFQMGFTNSVVYIDGEFYENSPTFTGTTTLNDPFYIFPGPTVSELRTLPVDQLTTSTASHTRYFTYSQSLPDQPHIKFSSAGTSRRYKRILKYFTSREGDVYLTKSLESFDSNGVGINDKAGFVLLDSNSGINDLPNLGGRFLKGWNSTLSLANIFPGFLGGSNSHSLTPTQLGNHSHNVSEAKFSLNYTKPFQSEYWTLSRVNLLSPMQFTFSVISADPHQQQTSAGGVVVDGTFVNMPWDTESYDPNNMFDLSTRKITWNINVGNFFLPIRFRISFTIQLTGGSSPGVPWQDSPSSSHKDDVVLMILRSRNPGGFPTTPPFNKNMSFSQASSHYQVPFKDGQGNITSNGPLYDLSGAVPGGLRLRYLIDNYGSQQDGNLPFEVSFVGDNGFGGSVYEVKGTVTSEYINPILTEEFLVYIARYPKDQPENRPYQAGALRLMEATMMVWYDNSLYDYSKADLHHYHYINTSRFNKDIFDNLITSIPLSDGKDPQNPTQWVSPDDPFIIQEYLADPTTGSLFGRQELGDFVNTSSTFFTGGVHKLQSTELQNHIHAITQSDFGDGIVGNDGAPHENRPPYFVTAYYTKKLN